MLLAFAGAFIFVLSALKLPSVTGSCSHPTGTGLGAILFGPLPMAVMGCIALLFQALLLAHGGLRRRARLDAHGRDESRHLEALDQILDAGKTPAEQMLDKFHGAWEGSVAPAYKEYCF